MISADPADLEAVESLVRQGRYRTVSEFVREAVSEKLSRHWQERLREQVDRYGSAGTDGGDDELIEWQAVADSATARTRKPSRAKR